MRDDLGLCLRLLSLFSFILNDVGLLFGLDDTLVLSVKFFSFVDEDFFADF